MAGDELVALFERAVADFTDKVRAVDDAQWRSPTPCSDWDVRALVSHVVYEQLWIPPLFEGQTIDEVGDRFDGDLLRAGAVAVASRSGAGAVQTLREPGALARTVQLSFGATPAEEYTHQLLADHLIHGWDLAAALGLDATLDPAATAVVADWFADREEMYRAGGVVGPPVPLPDDADPGDRLLAAFGRDPHWAP
jgi:uncharacterized protein (TIGR03086 family)